MAGKKNKSLKVVLTIVLCLLLISGIGVGIYFAQKNKKMKYYEVSLSSNTGSFVLSSQSKSLSPYSNIIDKPVVVNVANESNSSFIRGKIIFESNSLDDRMLSFVNQLNYKIKDTITFEGENYKWLYEKSDNSFYLVNKNETLRTVTNKNDDFIFIKNLRVPSDLEQILSLNREGNNVQIGEDVVVKIIFEAVQSELLLSKNPKIYDVREYFNAYSTNIENGFTSQNGYIVSCSKTDREIVLPKYVGDDYIIGIKSDAFNSQTLEKLIISGNYIIFEENCFSNCSNLNFVALRNYTKIDIAPNSFPQRVSLDIYTTKELSTHLKQNYSSFSVISNIKSYTEVLSDDLTLIDTKAEYLYSQNVEEFNANFKDFKSLKVVDFPALTKVSDEMFSGLTSLIYVNFPNANSVGKNAFSGCNNLVGLNLDKSLEELGESSFKNCKKLNNIDFVQKLNSIPISCFEECDSIVSINFSSSISIGSSAFKGCDNLKSVTISSLEQLDNYSFSDCSALKYFRLENNKVNEVNDSTFSGSFNVVLSFNDELQRNNFVSNNASLKTMLLKVQNGSLVKYDGNIKNLDLRELKINIQSILDNAFANNTLVENIYLPTTLNKIGKNFVKGCEKLRTIVIYSTKVISFDDSFDKDINSLTIKVPSTLVDVYKEQLKNYNINILSI